MNEQQVDDLAAAMWGQDPERGSWDDAPEYWREAYRDNAERAISAMTKLGWTPPQVPRN